MRTTIGTATLEIIHRARLVHACQAPTCCVAAAHGLVESGERRGGAAAFASTYRGIRSAALDHPFISRVASAPYACLRRITRELGDDSASGKSP